MSDENASDVAASESNPPSTLRILWAGMGSGLASLVITGVLWLSGPDAFSGYGGLRALDLFLWPMHVWPWAIVGGFFGGQIWSALASESDNKAAKIWLWATWLIGTLPLVAFVGSLFYGLSTYP